MMYQVPVYLLYLIQSRVFAGVVDTSDFGQASRARRLWTLLQHLAFLRVFVGFRLCIV